LTDHFPLAGLVGEAITDSKLHRKDLAGCWLVLLLGPRSRHVRSDSSLLIRPRANSASRKASSPTCEGEFGFYPM
jgi:hypothetical protein